METTSAQATAEGASHKQQTWERNPGRHAAVRAMISNQSVVQNISNSMMALIKHPTNFSIVENVEQLDELLRFDELNRHLTWPISVQEDAGGSMKFIEEYMSDPAVRGRRFESGVRWDVQEKQTARLGIKCLDGTFANNMGKNNAFCFQTQTTLTETFGWADLEKVGETLCRLFQRCPTTLKICDDKGRFGIHQMLLNMARKLNNPTEFAQTTTMRFKEDKRKGGQPSAWAVSGDVAFINKVTYIVEDYPIKVNPLNVLDAITLPKLGNLDINDMKPFDEAWRIIPQEKKASLSPAQKLKMRQAFYLGLWVAYKVKGCIASRSDIRVVVNMLLEPYAPSQQNTIGWYKGRPFYYIFDDGEYYKLVLGLFPWHDIVKQIMPERAKLPRTMLRIRILKAGGHAALETVGQAMRELYQNNLNPRLAWRKGVHVSVIVNDGIRGNDPSVLTFTYEGSISAKCAFCYKDALISDMKPHGNGELYHKHCLGKSITNDEEVALKRIKANVYMDFYHTKQLGHPIRKTCEETSLAVIRKKFKTADGKAKDDYAVNITLSNSRKEYPGGKVLLTSYPLSISIDAIHPRVVVNGITVLHHGINLAMTTIGKNRAKGIWPAGYIECMAEKARGVMPSPEYILRSNSSWSVIRDVAHSKKERLLQPESAHNQAIMDSFTHCSIVEGNPVQLRPARYRDNVMILPEWRPLHHVLFMQLLNDVVRKFGLTVADLPCSPVDGCVYAFNDDEQPGDWIYWTAFELYGERVARGYWMCSARFVWKDSIITCFIDSIYKRLQQIKLRKEGKPTPNITLDVDELTIMHRQPTRMTMAKQDHNFGIQTPYDKPLPKHGVDSRTEKDNIAWEAASDNYAKGNTDESELPLLIADLKGAKLPAGLSVRDPVDVLEDRLRKTTDWMWSPLSLKAKKEKMSIAQIAAKVKQEIMDDVEEEDDSALTMPGYDDVQPSEEVLQRLKQEAQEDEAEAEAEEAAAVKAAAARAKREAKAAEKKAKEETEAKEKTEAKEETEVKESGDGKGVSSKRGGDGSAGAATKRQKKSNA